MGADKEALPKLPQVYAEQLMATRLWRKDFPIAIFSTLTLLVAFLSFIFVGATLIKNWKDIYTVAKGFLFRSIVCSSFECCDLRIPLRAS